MVSRLLNHETGKNTKVILACAPVYLPWITESIAHSSLESWSKVTVPKDQLWNKIATGQLSEELNNAEEKIFIFPSPGEKHNLWKAMSPLLEEGWSLRYGFGNGDSSLAQLFRELTAERKKLLILDQLEEVFTKPNPVFAQKDGLTGEQAEIAGLADEICQLLSTTNVFKIILSFRADYLAEIEDELEKRLPNEFKKFLIKPLNREGIVEAIEGPLIDDHFELKYYDGFVDDMVHLLKEDSAASIAPALQVILKKLWDIVKNDTRHITKEIFEQAVSK